MAIKGATDQVATICSLLAMTWSVYLLTGCQSDEWELGGRGMECVAMALAVVEGYG
jgi:hypothetical protein